MRPTDEIGAAAPTGVGDEPGDGASNAGDTADHAGTPDAAHRWQQVRARLLQGDARRRRARRRWHVWVWLTRITLAVTLIGLWEWASETGRIDSFFFSQPSAIRDFLWDEFGSGVIWTHVSATVRATLLGFGLGSAVGVVLGVLRGQFEFFGAVSGPFLTAMNALPRVALAPMFIIWFGIGEMSKVMIAASLVVFIMMINTEAGLRSVDKELVFTLRSLGANRRQQFTRVALPGMVPAVFGGLRLAVVYSLLGVVVGEMLASRRGLGQRIQLYAASFRVQGVLGTILVLAAIALVLSAIVGLLERRLLRWSSNSD